jgi:UDP-N-acetylmuramate--alanine ligase
MKHAIQHIHFTGIGGAGMSAIAQVVHQMGYRVSGSDRVASDTTRRLAELGVAVFTGHHAAHIAGAQVVVTSTAIAADNPEVVAAHAQRIPVVQRAVLLAEHHIAGGQRAYASRCRPHLCDRRQITSCRRSFAFG